MIRALFAIAIGIFAFGLPAHAHEGHEHGGMNHLVFAHGEFHAHATWEAGPMVSGESRLKIEWKNGTTHMAAEPPGAFQVSLYMPSMGHGSAPTQIQRALDPQGLPLVGVYQVSNVYFIMGGDWQVNVTLTYLDGTKETQTIDVELPQTGGHRHGH